MHAVLLFMFYGLMLQHRSDTAELLFMFYFILEKAPLEAPAQEINKLLFTHAVLLLRHAVLFMHAVLFNVLCFIPLCPLCGGGPGNK